MKSSLSSERCSLVIATRNAHKLAEIRAILGASFDYRTLNDYPAAPKVVEDAGTFAGNATKKAVELARWLASIPRPEFHSRPAWVLADDSGLEVDALNSAPGVHSARFAALDSGRPENSPDAHNNAKLLRLLAKVPPEKRSARFRCVLALTPVCAPATGAGHHRGWGGAPVCYADEAELQTEIFEGVCEGRIGFEPRGQNGFGYDPLFIPADFQQTFAELGEEVKNQISHRAQALAKLKQRFQRGPAPDPAGS